MEVNKQKTQIKTIKKNIREDIKSSLINGLKEVAGKFNADTTNIEKEIDKSAKQLAKKFVKGIMNEHITLDEDKPAAKAEAPVTKGKAAKQDTAERKTKKTKPAGIAG
jgi:hypothetical protein